MDFTHKKNYKNNKICENFYIDDIEVKKHVYEMLDDNEFERHIKNTKTKEVGFTIDEQKQIPNLCQSVQDLDSFTEEIVDIVNYIKISNVIDCVDKIIEIIDAIGEQQYKVGYIQALEGIRSGVDKAIVKSYKNIRGKK